MVKSLAVLAILGLLSILPPYLGPAVGLELGDIDSSVEIVDHVIPGILIFLCAGGACLLLRAGRIKKDSMVLASAAAVCLLASVWQLSSHAPLVLDGGKPESPWGAVILHSTLGPVMVLLSLWIVLRALAVEPAEEPESQSAARSRRPKQPSGRA
jgi:hypothetical protein